MRIQHNISALNAHGRYTANNSALAKNLTKLSSGYRINSAADDAAGLAISEKMRSQIKGLEKAQDNANDGISLIQTAEGALTEVNSMLTRLTELATQSANGTYDTEVDRLNIQEETNALLKEIDRISESTNFNGITLLDGSLSGSQVENLVTTTTATSAGKFTTGTAGEIDATGFTVADIGKSIDYSISWKDASGQEKVAKVTLTYQGSNGKDKIDTAVTNNYFTDSTGEKYYLATGSKLAATTVNAALFKGLQADGDFSSAFSIENKGSTLQMTAKQLGSAGGVIMGAGETESLTGSISFGAATSISVTEGADAKVIFTAASVLAIGSGSTQAEIDKAIFEIDGHRFIASNNANTTTKALVDDDVTIIDGVTAADFSTEISRITGIKTSVSGGNVQFEEDINIGSASLELQVGDTNDSYQKVNVEIKDMSSNGLGLAGLDLSTQEAAGNSIDTIKKAVNMVSTQRGKLGALQNRLDHTVNNLVATTENITASESRIRDVDMAKEMTQYSKNNILLQASQSMLAQANQLPQGVLQLLQ